MSLLETLRRGAARWTARGFDLLCPPRCGLCGADVAAAGDAALVCAACEPALVADRPRCLGCGAGGDPAGCGRCGPRTRPCDGLAVLGPYADELREAILRAKRPAGAAVAATLAALLVHRHRETCRAWAVDVVVPVPMHWRRRVVRGTSAADELARGVAAGLGLPCRRWLVRHRGTRMQNELPPEERRGNVAGAFRASRAVAGRRLLLVDDVATTGSTLAACRNAAVSAGAAAVYAAVVARAERAEPGGEV
jgi:ComF family protein